MGIQPASYYRTDREKIDVRRRGLRAVTRLAKKQLLPLRPTHTHTHTRTALVYGWRGVAKKKRQTEGKTDPALPHTSKRTNTELLFLCEQLSETLPNTANKYNRIKTTLCKTHLCFQVFYSSARRRDTSLTRRQGSDSNNAFIID